MMKIIRTSLGLLGTCILCLLVGCGEPESGGTPVVETASGSGGAEGPTYFDGKPLGAQGPNGSVEKPEAITEKETASGSGGAEGPTYFDGKPLGTAGPNGTDEKTERESK